MLNRKLLVMLTVTVGVLSLGFLACGGGGGGSGSSGGGNTPITNTRTYFLDDDGYYEPGYRLQFNLSGTGSNREALTMTGTLSISTKAQVEIGGETLIPIERLLNINIVENSSSLTQFVTYYYDTNHNPVRYIVADPPATCVPAQTIITPAIARVGDFGQMTPWDCDDGSSFTGTWILEPGPDPYAVYTVHGTIYDATGSIIGTETDYLTIDESGDPKSVRMEAFIGGITITLNGVRVLK